MRVFVTGATGVIGRRVVPGLVARGHEVTAIGRTPEKRRALERQGARAADASLFDEDALARALAGHDAVINLATHIPGSPARMMLPWAWRENDRVRRDGSAALARAMRRAGVGRLVQESFAPVYADGGAAWIDERWPVRAIAHTRTVLDAERAAAGVTEAGGAGVVLRFAGFYGPDSPLLHEMVRVVRRGWAPLPGAPDAYFPSIALDDAASAAVAALDLPAGVYNVGDDEPLTRAELARALARAAGAGEQVRHPPAWLLRLAGPTGELLARSVRVSNRKLREASGWAPRFPSAREGLAAALGAEPGA